jgi:nicotinate dehydrogenase subunit A
VLRTLELNVNGRLVAIEVDDTASLLDVLRNDVGLTGPRYGCGAEQCGSCAVLIDGVERAACGLEAGAADGKAILTVEGLGTPGHPHPLQTAFLELQAGQCGYCLSGILVGAKALLDVNPSPTRAEVASHLAWHLCRCGAQNRIMDAVLLAADRMRRELAA